MEVNSSLILEDGTLSIPNITEGEFASREGVSYYCTATKTFGTIRSRSVDVFYACEYVNVEYKLSECIYMCGGSTVLEPFNFTHGLKVKVL